MSLFTGAHPDDALRCPRDETEMAKIELQGIVVDRCLECGGTWFDEDEIRILNEGSKPEQLSRSLGAFAAPPTFGCPRCGGACSSLKVEDVVVEACHECRGVWIDAPDKDAPPPPHVTTLHEGGRRESFWAILSRL